MVRRLASLRAAFIAAGMAVALLGVTGLCEATPPPNPCEAIYSSARAREQSGRLREAQGLFLSCAKTECGVFLYRECMTRSVRLDSDIPSVVPIVTDGAGAPRVDVSVTMDGGLLTAKLDGRSLPVDPGLHEFVFSSARRVFATQRVMILQGERNRMLSASLTPEFALEGGGDRPGCSRTAEGGDTASGGGSPSCPQDATREGRTAKSARSCSLEFEATVWVASAYVFRGYNVFQSGSQRDQNMALFARIIGSVPRTGLSAGYSSVYQLTGDNVGRNIQMGLGAEQVAFVDYDVKPASRLTLTPEIATWVYPAARTVPLFLEASTEVTYLGPADLGLYVGFLGAVRPGPLSENHLYVSPKLERTFDLPANLALLLQASAGVKIFTAHPGALNSNMFDVLASVALYHSFRDALYVGAKIGLAWTNLEPRTDATTGEEVSFGLTDEYVPFASVSAGGEW